MNNELDVTHIENMLSGIKHQKFHVVQSTTTKNSIALLGKTWNTYFVTLFCQKRTLYLVGS